MVAVLFVSLLIDQVVCICMPYLSNAAAEEATSARKEQQFEQPSNKGQSVSNLFWREFIVDHCEAFRV